MPDVLLDSHAVLWYLVDDPRLSPTARQAIDDDENAVFVSAVTFYELIFKAARQRRATSVLRLPVAVEQTGFETLTPGPSTWRAAAETDWSHADPFDRLLLAQAAEYDLGLVSADEIFDDVSKRRIW
ncbi:MAG: type II toxin-antitoxin system VapC family toxin [Parvularculaceae bacterium]